MKNDPVNHPGHYTSHPSGVECIQITEHLNFCLGNAIKYLWRAGLKGDSTEDLKKAAWYIDREIKRITNDDDTIRHRDERLVGRTNNFTLCSDDGIGMHGGDNS